MILIVDTGPLVAAFNEKDRAHKVCTELLETTPAQLIVPAPVLTEGLLPCRTAQWHAG